MPFNVKNKTIEGQLGEGEYRIKIEGNSDLTVERNPEVPTPETISQESESVGTNVDGQQTTDEGQNSQRLGRKFLHRRVDNKLAIAVQ